MARQITPLPHLTDESGIPFQLIGGKPAYNTEAAAQYTGLAPNTIRNLGYTGQLTRLKLGRTNRYYRNDLDELIRDRIHPAQFRS